MSNTLTINLFVSILKINMLKNLLFFILFYSRVFSGENIAILRLNEPGYDRLYYKDHIFEIFIGHSTDCPCESYLNLTDTDLYSKNHVFEVLTHHSDDCPCLQKNENF